MPTGFLVSLNVQVVSGVFPLSLGGDCLSSHQTPSSGDCLNK